MKGMGKSRWLSWAAALSLMFLFAVSAWAQAPVKNVILLIGDGMGINQISAARLSLADGARSVLNLDTMPYTGFSLNFANNNLVTDSAAAATALATGFRTDTGKLGTLPDGTPAESIMLKAKEQGLSIGLVTTVKVTDATPAAFLVNADHRAFERDIARAILQAQPDVLLGGGAELLALTPSPNSPKAMP